MTSAELVAALRTDGRLGLGRERRRIDIVEAAADFIERVEALRHTLPCPRGCVNGHVLVTGTDKYGLPNEPSLRLPCPENNGACDGFMSWERIVAIVAAVFDRGDEVVACSGEQVFDYLRGVRP